MNKTELVAAMAEQTNLSNSLLDLVHLKSAREQQEKEETHRQEKL